MIRISAICCAVMCVAVLGAEPAPRGDIRSAIDRLENGYVRMTFESRDGVCGDGWNSISLGGNSIHIGRHDDDYWERDCEEGPVRVLMKVRDGEVIRIKTRVGGRWRAGHDRDLDLGEVSPQEAVDFLLDLAATSKREAAKDAVLPAMLARDAEVWPRLMGIARRDDRPTDVRKSAVFWLSQIAGEKVAEGIVELVHDDDADMEVRETALFALSQRDGRRSLEHLIRIAKTSQHPQIRRRALFWLGQRDEPEALDYIEQVLLGD